MKANGILVVLPSYPKSSFNSKVQEWKPQYLSMWRILLTQGSEQRVPPTYVGFTHPSIGLAPGWHQKKSWSPMMSLHSSRSYPHRKQWKLSGNNSCKILWTLEPTSTRNCSLLGLCPATIYFKYKKGFHRQMHGCGKGSTVSPIVANS